MILYYWNKDQAKKNRNFKLLYTPTSVWPLTNSHNNFYTLVLLPMRFWNVSLVIWFLTPWDAILPQNNFDFVITGVLPKKLEICTCFGTMPSVRNPTSLRYFERIIMNKYDQLSINFLSFSKDEIWIQKEEKTLFINGYTKFTYMVSYIVYSTFTIMRQHSWIYMLFSDQLKLVYVSV